MYIYFNKLGELTTIIPHGEIVRQGTWFTLNVALDKDTDMSNLNMWFRFKRRGNERFVGDENYQGHFDMIKSGIQTFHKVEPKEATFDLVDGQDYAVFTYKVSTDTGLTAIDGNVEIVFTLTEQVTNEDGQQVTEDVKMQGRANIYVEPTYGLHPERGLDLSVSEYATIMQTINQLQNSLKVTNITIEESENAVKDTEYNVTVTYNDKSAQTFRSMFLEQYLSSASVDTDNMQLTITKSDGTKLIFEGLNAKKVMEVVNANSVLGEATVVLKKSTDAGIQLTSEKQAMTNNGVYKYFGGYLIRLEPSQSGSLTSEQYKILSNNNNAVLSMNGDVYTLSKFVNGKIYYHHISGLAEDFIIVDQNYTWTTDHVTFDVVDLAQQLAELKLDLLSKVDKLQTISQYPKAYVEYIEDGKPVQGSISVVDTDTTSGSIARRLQDGEVLVGTPTQNNGATPKGYVDNALNEKLDKITTITPLQQVYTKSPSGVQEMVNASNTPVGGYFAKFTANKTLRTEAPVNDDDCANKKYVDDELSTKADLVDGKVPASQLPDYVDDVIEALIIATSASEIPDIHEPNHFVICIGTPTDEESLAILTAQQWKLGSLIVRKYAGTWSWERVEALRKSAIYITTSDNKTYRYTYVNATQSGLMVEISQSLALGETSSTAYAGDKGKDNRDDIDAILDGTKVANKAYRDSKGNIITEAYATKKDLGNKLDKIETSSFDGVYGVLATNSIDPFQTESVFNPTTNISPTNIGTYVLQYKTIIGLNNKGYAVPMDSYNITSTLFEVTRASGVPIVGFRFNATSGKSYTIHLLTAQSHVITLQYFTADGTRLGEDSKNYYNNNVFTVPTYEQEVAYGVITIKSASAGYLGFTLFQVIELNAQTVQTLFSVAQGVIAGTIPLRTYDGNLKTGTPIYNADCVRLDYLNTQLGKKLAKVTTTGGLRAYTINAQGEQTVTSAKASPSIGALVLFNNNRSITVAETPVEDTDAVSKKYVDSHSPIPVEIALTGTSGTLTDVQYEALSNRLTYLTLSSSEFRRTRTETDTLTYGNFYVTTNGINVEEIKISTTNKTWTYTSKVAQFKIEVGVTAGDKVELRID